MKLSLTLLVAIAASGALAARAEARTTRGGRAARSPRAHTGGVVATRSRSSGSGGKVAVQPFEGAGGEQLRVLVTRIVHGRGFHTMTSLPHYEGTGQYPSLARDHHLAAFVTGDVEERGKWTSITFLVWNGLTGSVIGRWTAASPTTAIARAVGRGFWQHLGPAVARAEAPPLPLDQDQGPTMRIDASNSLDAQPIATR